MSTKKERQGRAVEGEGNVFPIAIPPFAAGNPRIWVEDNDFLRLSGWTLASSLSFELQYLLQRPDGQIVRYSETVGPSISSSAFTLERAMEAGWLVSVDAVPSSAVAPRETWAGLELTFGSSGSRVVSMTLSRAYISTRTHLSWPFGPLEMPLSVPGSPAIFEGTAPASATKYVEAVPDTQLWRLLGGHFRLQTSVNAGTRNPFLTIYDASDVPLLKTWWTGGQSTNLIWDYSFGPTLPFSSQKHEAETTPLPALLLRAGTKIEFDVENMQTGDQISEIRFMVERWLEDQL